MRKSQLLLAVAGALAVPGICAIDEGASGETTGGGGTESQPPKPAKPKKDKKKATPAAPAKGKEKKPAPKKKASGESGAHKGVKGPGILKQYAPTYRKGGPKGDAKTASGNKAIDNGDKVANLLLGKNLDEVYKLAVDTLNSVLEEGQEKVTKASLLEKYGKLNPGMQRMNLGNRMRGALGLAKTPAKKA